jgi:hypothetical protein
VAEHVEVTVRRLRREEGFALITALVVLIMLTVLGMAAVLTASRDIDIAGSQKRASRAFYLAEAGIEHVRKDIVEVGFVDDGLSPMHNVFSWLDGLVGDTLIADCSLSAGTYTVVVVDVIDRGTVAPFTSCRDIHLTSIGIDHANNETRTIEFVDRVGLVPTDIFNYAYFMNHFGWMSGFGSGNLIVNGNAKANGHMHLLAGHWTVNGNPRYDIFTGLAQDDGGAYAHGYVITNGTWHGMAANPINRHDQDPFTRMPNLNDSGDSDGDGNVQEISPYYEELARGLYPDSPMGRVGVDANGDGTLQASEILFEGVLGDDPGEKQNIYIEGTAAAPILVEGPVVVRGDLIISGVVSGHGSFYTGRNVHVPKNLQYLDPPATPPVFNWGVETPAEYAARVDTWYAANRNADLVCLAARENIVTGDYSAAQFNGPMGWLHDHRNNGREDVGYDGVFGRMDDPHSPYGPSDGENDHTWTVLCRNTTTNEVQWMDLAVIAGSANPPVGWVVVPGSGEDVDGDGEYDDRYELPMMELASAVDTAFIANLPASATSFSDLCDGDDKVGIIEALLYTNHASAGLYDRAPSVDSTIFNGSVVARNEAWVIHGNGKITMTHDERLNTRYWQDIESTGLILPRVKAVLAVGWREVID